jgi:DNA topoisomerase IB
VTTLVFDYQPDQLRIPRGNGRRSGRWLDSPGQILEGIADLAEPTSTLPTVDVASSDLKQGDGVLLPGGTVHEVTSAKNEGRNTVVTTRNPRTGESRERTVPKTARWKKVLMALAAVGVLAGLAFGGFMQGAADSPDPATSRPDVTQSQTQHAPAPKTAKGYANMWAEQVDTAEWGGADISISERLPDGRRVWLYGDTLSGNNGFVHSTAITQDGGTLHVSDGGKQLLPNEAKTPDGRQTIYWIEKAEAVGDNMLQVWAAPISVGEQGPWDFHRANPDSRVAMVTIDAQGNAHFEDWKGYTQAPADSMIDHGHDDAKAVEPGHWTYQGFTHDIRLADGSYLHTLNQNWDDGFENHMNEDGTLRFEDWRPIFEKSQTPPAGQWAGGTVVYEGVPDQWRVPRGNGDRSGRWVDMPGAILDSLRMATESGESAAAFSVDLQPEKPGDRERFKQTFGQSIPPAWTDVSVDFGKGADLIARGKTKTGKSVYLYTEAYKAQQQAAKYARLNEVFERLPAIDEALSSIDGDPTKAVARLMYLEGIRVGSSEKQQGKVMAYGAATLRSEHASILPNGNVRLAFTAKEGIPAEYEIDDPELVDFISQRLHETGGESEPLFDTNAARTIDYLKQISGLPGMKNHDLRTLLANRIAAAEVAKSLPPAPRTKREALALRKRIAEIVAAQLRNKPAQALSSYINPAVFAPIMEVA